MTEQKALRRRIAPFTPITLELDEPGGKVKVELKLAFNMNAGVAVQEKTRAPHRPDGLMLTSIGFDGVWAHIREPIVQRAMLWAASLAHHPEYDTATDEGLETIGTYLQENNSDEVAETLWSAYMAYLSPAKRAFMQKIRDSEEKARGDKPKNEQPPAENMPANPSESTGSNSGPSPEVLVSAPTNSES
jgi:hypothetical protein